MKLYDPYFKTEVDVVDTGVWDNPSYIQGKYYLVRYPDGTVMKIHESALEARKDNQ